LLASSNRFVWTMDEVEQDMSGFGPLLCVAEVVIEKKKFSTISNGIFFQVSGFMAVVLMGLWTGHHLGGFAASDDPQHQFNWHPLLMTIGMIFLYGNGIYSKCSILLFF